MNKKTVQSENNFANYQSLSGSTEKNWWLRLYVAGQTALSLAALQNVQKIQKQYLQHADEIEVIDLLQYPHRAKEDRIVVIPTLVRKKPEPVMKIVGDLSSAEKVLFDIGYCNNHLTTRESQNLEKLW